MMKPRHSFRSQATAIIALAPTIWGVALVSHQSQAIANPVKTSLISQKSSWDWQDSSDIKNGVVSPLLADYYQTVENLATNVYNYTNNPIIGDVKKVFDINAYKDVNTTNAAFDQKYGCFVASAAILEIDKKDMTLVYSGKSSLYRQIAIDAAAAALNPKSTDQQMRYLNLLTVENYVRSTAWLSQANLRAIERPYIDEENVSLLSGYAAGSINSCKAQLWKDNEYTSLRSKKIVFDTAHALSLKNEFNNYINYLKEGNDPIPALRAEILTQAKARFKKSIEVASLPK